LRIAKGLNAETQSADVLFTKMSCGREPQNFGQLRVVAQGGMGVQWQVVGKEVDVVLEQKRQACFHPSRHDPTLSSPKESMVNQYGLGLSLNGFFDQGQACGDAADNVMDFSRTFHLQAIGPIVFEVLGHQDA
jgi:hypothetical protein